MHAGNNKYNDEDALYMEYTITIILYGMHAAIICVHACSSAQ